MKTEDLIKHIDQVLSTAQSEGAKATINNLLDLRNLIQPSTNK